MIQNVHVQFLFCNSIFIVNEHHYVHNMTHTYIQIFITNGLDHKLSQH